MHVVLEAFESGAEAVDVERQRRDHQSRHAEVFEALHVVED